jgi:hypothetical protein
MLQQLVVLAAVAAAAAYVAWSLAPARARFTWLSRLDAALARREQAARRSEPGLMRARVLAPLLRRAQPSGGCGSCGSNAAAIAPRAVPRPREGARRP